MIGRYKNKTNKCDICGNELKSGKTFREYKNAMPTGRLMCRRCYDKNYQKNNPYSFSNMVKSMRKIRNNRLELSSTTGKGYLFEQITCKARGIKNLNIENDNFNSKFDHSKDPVYGILQTKGSLYNIENKLWHISCLNEHIKEFDNLILYCFDKNMNNIERVYIFPKKEVILRSVISIVKYPSKYSWYEKYRVDEKNYDDAYKNLTEKDLKGLRIEKNICSDSSTRKSERFVVSDHGSKSISGF